MRRRLALGCAVGVLAACTAALAGDTMGRPGVPPTPPITDREIEPFGLVVSWKALAILGGNAELTGLYPTNEEVFVTDTYCRLSSYTAKDGARQWGVALDRPTQPEFAPLADRLDVYTVAAGHLIDIDRRSGRERWRVPIKHVPVDGPAVIADLLYVACADGWLHVYKRRDGEEVWNYNARMSLVSRPVPVGAEAQMNIFIACKDRLSTQFRLECLSNNERKILWQMPREDLPPTEPQVTAAVVAAPARFGRTLYIPSTDFNVYGVNGTTGKVVSDPDGKWSWVFRSGSQVVSSPVVIGPTVYFASLRNGFYAVRREDGQKRWWRETGVKLLSVGRRRCYILDAENAILVCDKMTGKLEGRFVPPAGYVWFPTNEFSDALYLMTREGLIVCLREKETIDVTPPVEGTTTPETTTSPAPETTTTKPAEPTTTAPAPTP